jgi:RNA polymerase sigma-70 factor, ECF subfamily
VLQATALVNEVYLKLLDIRRVQWQDRAHFFAMAARLMRRVLVDFARASKNQKRGGARQRITFDLPVGGESPEDLIVIDDAARALAGRDGERMTAAAGFLRLKPKAPDAE